MLAHAAHRRYFFCLYGSRLPFYGHFQRLGKLVGTRRHLFAAVNAVKTFDHVLRTLSLHQCRNTLQVAVAASGKSHVIDYSVLNLKFDKSATRADGLVLVFHIFAFFAKLVNLSSL
jgi:hypothetical protein